MKITQIETFKCWVDWCNLLLVKVSTDEGLHGWGEGSMHGPVQVVETAIHEMRETLIGQDPAGVERHWHRLYHAWRWRGGAGESVLLNDDENNRLAEGIGERVRDAEIENLAKQGVAAIFAARRRLLPFASGWVGRSQLLLANGL